MDCFFFLIAQCVWSVYLVYCWLPVHPSEVRRPFVTFSLGNFSLVLYTPHCSVQCFLLIPESCASRILSSAKYSREVRWGAGVKDTSLLKSVELSLLCLWRPLNPAAIDCFASKIKFVFEFSKIKFVFEFSNSCVLKMLWMITATQFEFRSGFDRNATKAWPSIKEMQWENAWTSEISFALQLNANMAFFVNISGLLEVINVNRWRCHIPAENLLLSSGVLSSWDINSAWDCAFRHAQPQPKISFATAIAAVMHLTLQCTTFTM